MDYYWEYYTLNFLIKVNIGIYTLAHPLVAVLF